jgi:chromosomal replication initiation ATPase DnaA
MENKMNYWAAPCFHVKQTNLIVKTDNIIADVCQVYDIELADLMSKKRFRILVEPRQILFYILHKKLNIPCTRVGAMFNKNHATVLYGANNIKSFIEYDKELRERVTGVLIRNDFYGLLNTITTSSETVYKR